MSESNLQAFLPYVNKTTSEVVFAIELTDALINIMRNTPGLISLAAKSRPGDFAVGFECRVIPRDEFLEGYMALKT